MLKLASNITKFPTKEIVSLAATIVDVHRDQEEHYSHKKLQKNHHTNCCAVSSSSCKVARLLFAAEHGSSWSRNLFGWSWLFLGKFQDNLHVLNQGTELDFICSRTLSFWCKAGFIFAQWHYGGWWWWQWLLWGNEICPSCKKRSLSCKKRLPSPMKELPSCKRRLPIWKKRFESLKKIFRFQ